MDGWEPSGQGPIMAFEVEDFNAMIEKLKKAEVKFLMEPMLFPTCRMTQVWDTEGNTVMIHKLS